MEDVRETIKALLKEKRYQEILDLFGKTRKLVRIVRSLLYAEEALVKWRAVTFMGRLAAERPGWIKKEVDRLLWSLNDEAGAIGRSAPEAIGEIAWSNMGLARDAAGVVAEYLRDPETCRPPNRNVEILIGVLWAVARIGSREPGLVEEVLPVAAGFLDDPEPAVRGHAAWALGRAGRGAFRRELQAAVQDNARFHLYEDEDLRDASVGAVAREALGGGAAGTQGK